MIEKVPVERIKQECMNVLSSENVFNNCNLDFLAKYRAICQVKQIQAVMESGDLVNTAKVLFENDLNITLASKQGYMHRNTLIYRIEKIRRLIGLDIRVFREAVVFENLIMYYEMLKKR